MEKEKIIIVGLGISYKYYKKIIMENFDIVALADNHLERQKMEAGQKYINLEKIKEEVYDKVLVCTDKYFAIIKEQLIGYGIDSEKIIGLKLVGQIKYIADKEKYMSMSKDSTFEYLEENENMQLSDYCKEAGTVDGHYFYQDILVASEIIKNKPQNHIDIGSRVDGFISHLLAAGVETSIIDIRPLKLNNIGFGVPKLHFIQADATNLEHIDDNSINSLSSLHAVEHFGLGRYGDEIDPEAHFKAMHSLERVLAVGGTLYFSVPIGKRDKVCFNAHRIFSPLTVVNTMDKLNLVNMFLIHDAKIIQYTKEEVVAQRYMENIGGYDCGIFIFKKIKGNESVE